ncbi:BORC7 protein, partial [Amia calva]|nr:BORC7 protein [Amia calva]
MVPYFFCSCWKSMCGCRSLLRLSKLPMMGSEGRLGGLLMHILALFIFPFTNTTVRTTATSTSAERANSMVIAVRCRFEVQFELFFNFSRMASPEPQPRFGQSVKGLLSEKVSSCSGDVIALTRQVLKGSRSQELLGQAARNMVMQEDAILHSEDSLRKMSIITTHLQYQQEAIQKNVEHSRNLQDQLNHLLK